MPRTQNGMITAHRENWVSRTGFAAAVVVLLLWLGSTWYGYSWASAPNSNRLQYYIALHRGTINLWRLEGVDLRNRTGFTAYGGPEPMDRWFPVVGVSPGRVGLAFPVWLLFLLIAVLTAWASWRGRFLRLRRGLCPNCVYPMGKSTVCTECGKPLPGRSRHLPA